MIDLNFLLYSFIALFIIVDPIANVPIFMGILSDFNRETRREIVKKSVIIATITLVIFTISGEFVFRYLHIEIYSFRIAGGFLLFIIAIEMLFGKRTGTVSSTEEEEEARVKEDVAITPLAVPLLSGPGAITTSIVLFNSAQGISERFIVLFDIGAVFFISYFILSRSEKVFDALGYTGTRVIVRIMGLLLASIAIQFIITGIKEAFLGIGHV